MSKILFFTFILKILVLKSDQAVLDLEQEIQYAAEEFARLHFVDDLSSSIEKIRTPDGILWLRSFVETRRITFGKVMTVSKYLPEEMYIHLNWDKDLQLFETHLTKYIKKLGQSSTMSKISYNVESKQTIVQPGTLKSSNNYDIEDSIATDEEIEKLLRNHKPFEDHELKEQDEDEERRIDEELKTNSEHFSEDVDPMTHSADERKLLQPEIKKFQIIKQKLIQGLLKTRHQLLLKSLKGKSMSELRYVEGILLADRITAQFDVWNRFAKDTKDFDKLPQHLQILKHDNEYRKFLNIHDAYFRGNSIYGYKDRYDDPSNFNYDFELTAKPIIGKRFKPMHKLANEMQDFKSLSNDYDQCVLKDLPTIEMFLETFKSLTFDFEQSRFKKNQWFFPPSIENKYQRPLIKSIKSRDRFLEFLSADKIYDRISIQFIYAKERRADPYVITEPISTKILRYKKETMESLLLQHLNFRLSTLPNEMYDSIFKKIRMILIDKLFRCFITMSYANSLPELTKTSLFQQQSALQHRRMMIDYSNNKPKDERKHNEIVNEVKKKESFIDKLNEFRESLDRTSDSLKVLDEKMNVFNTVPGTSNTKQNEIKYGTGGYVDVGAKKGTFSNHGSNKGKGKNHLANRYHG